MCEDVKKNIFEDAFNTYISCMKEVEGDKFFVEKEGEMIEL